MRRFGSALASLVCLATVCASSGCLFLKDIGYGQPTDERAEQALPALLRPGSKTVLALAPVELGFATRLVPLATSAIVDPFPADYPGADRLEIANFVVSS